MRRLHEAPSLLLGRHAPALRRVVPRPMRRRVYATFYRSLPDAGRAAVFARRCRLTAEYCRRNGSPLYAHLLCVVADDIDAGGPCADLVGRYGLRGEVPPPAHTRALLAAVHRVVLEEPGTPLAAHYPTVGGTVDLATVGSAFISVVADRRDRVLELMQRPVQTNEVTRSRALVGGFLLAAERTGLPLRILELGASGGLNLRWDHYYYEAGGASWGDPASPVRLLGGFSHGRPPFHLDACVVERRGCDLAPLDAATAKGRLTLLSQVWPDQLERVELLRGAFAVAERVDAPIDRADVLGWAEAQLATPRPGVCTVVFDTGVKEYLAPPVLEGLDHIIGAAGARAGASNPLARLHIEPVRGVPGVDGELELVLWPGEHRQTLARNADPYARDVRWIASG
jgi:hypothetical protein